MLSISVKDVNQQRFTKAFAKFLKKSGKVKVPEWADLVKTGCFKELAPFSENWYYVRVAAVARHLYIRSPAGVGAVKKIFGGRVNRGSAPSHYVTSSGAVCRRALQTLESLKLVEKHPDGGRRLTSQGFRDLDRIAAQLKFKANANRSKARSKTTRPAATTRTLASKVAKTTKTKDTKKVDVKKLTKKTAGDKKAADKKAGDKKAGDKKAAAVKKVAAPKKVEKVAEKKPAAKKPVEKKAKPAKAPAKGQ